MKTTKIFRFEDETGDGPYGKVGVLDTHCSDNGHPSPTADYVKGLSTAESRYYFACYLEWKMGIIANEWDMKFGCNSIEQLKAWFSEKEMALLFDRGYRLVELIVDSRLVNELGHQVMYYSKRILDKRECDPMMVA